MTSKRLRAWKAIQNSVEPDTGNRNDNFITPMPAFVTGSGTGIANINHPTSIAAFPNSNDFILVQSSEGVAYGALWMVYSSTSDFQGWLPRFDPARMEDQSVEDQLVPLDMVVRCSTASVPPIIFHAETDTRLSGRLPC